MNPNIIPNNSLPSCDITFIIVSNKIYPNLNTLFFTTQILHKFLLISTITIIITAVSVPTKDRRANIHESLIKNDLFRSLKAETFPTGFLRAKQTLARRIVGFQDLSQQRTISFTSRPKCVPFKDAFDPVDISLLAQYEGRSKRIPKANCREAIADVSSYLFISSVCPFYTPAVLRFFSFKLDSYVFPAFRG